MLVAAVLLAFSATAYAAQGKTLTGWDCCKPACAWTSNLRRSGASGQVKTCNKRDEPLSNRQGNREASSCASRDAGDAYLCSDYSPKIVDDGLAYGFAVTDGLENCCKCFELTWLAGPAQGKRIQVQVINEGGETDDGREFVILTPGGGVGPNEKGCRSQYGGDWGRQYGGFTSRDGCMNLPAKLQEGCYWRFNWAGGEMNDWPVDYKQVQCADYLTNISGCKAN